MPKQNFEDTKPFKKARYIKSSAAKGSYIVFYAWDKQKNDLVRKRTYIPAKYKTEVEKKAYARNKIKVINKWLKEGFHFDKKKSKSQEVKEKQKEERRQTKVYLVSEAVKEVIKLKELAQNFDKGIKFYKSRLNQLVEWLQDNGEDCLLEELSHPVLRDFFNQKMKKEGWSAKTYNLTLGALKTFYNDCIDEEWVNGANPFGKFKKLPEDYGEKNKPYSNELAVKIKEHILENDPYLWTIISFTYYAFLRGTEMMRLKVADIDLQNNLIWVSGKQSKTKKKDVIPIAPALRKVIDSMELEKCNPGHYLLTSYQKPHSVKMGQNYIGKRYRKVKDHFNLHDDYTIYGFKHTAVVNWYKKEKDIRKIQKMCRHSSILMTERYLKSMGLLDDNEAVSMLPEI